MTMLEKFIQFINKMFASINTSKIGVKYSYNSSYTEKGFKEKIMRWIQDFPLQERKELINSLSLNWNRDKRAIFDLIEITEALNNYVQFAKDNHINLDYFNVLFEFQIIKGFAGVVCFAYLDLPIFDEMDYNIDDISNLILSKEETKEITDKSKYLREIVLNKFYQLKKTCYYPTDNADTYTLLQKTTYEEEGGYTIIANGEGDTSYSFFLNMQDY